jgi:lipid II:glycine glycyltransferase (peptidoglycan interpeptide bridge formation enzyme)
MRDIRQSSEYAEHLSLIGWKVENVSGVFYFIRKIPLFGSILKVQRPQKLDVITIKRIEKNYKSFQTIVEPKDENQARMLKSQGYHPTKNHYLPTKTLVLDLKKSREKIIMSFKKDARYALRKSSPEKDKIRSLEEKEIARFRILWKRAVGLKRYVPQTSHLYSLKKSFGENCLFLLSKGSGAIFLKSGESAYYWQAFTDKDARKKLLQYQIVGQGIVWAKEKNAKYFDLEGIYDSRFPDKSWLGFTHFKKSFGGDEITFPGAYTMLHFPFLK